MKVLMIGPFPPVINGVTVSNDYLFRWLEGHGIHVSRINTETGSIASRQGDRISIKKIIAFLSIYWEIFRITNKDAVYMTCGQTFWGFVKYLPFVWYCRVLHIPYVLHIHGGYLCKGYEKLSPRKQSLFRYMINRSASVIALSDTLAEEIKHTFPAASVHVVENFYDPSLIKPAGIRTASSKPRFLFLSNLMLGKGILEFLDALIILQDVYQFDFSVSLAGSVEKGLAEELDKRCQKLGDKITFFGLADLAQKKKLLYTSDIFVLPTWYKMEGQPISIIEAYVTGNVVVATHQGGIADISKYDTFFYVPGQDALQLSKTLLEVCQKLPQLTDQLAVTATHTQNRFAPHWFGKKIELIFTFKKELSGTKKV